MKLICFIDSLNVGGAQKQMSHLVAGFQAGGHEVTLVLLHPIYSIPLQVPEGSVKILLLPGKSTFARVLHFVRLLNQLQPDQVISFLDFPNLINEAARLFRPFANTKITISERAGFQQPVSAFTQFRMQFHRLAHRVVTNSEENASWIEQHFYFLKGKIQTIYNMVHLPPVKEHLTENQVPKIHVIANFRKEKNVAMVIQVCQTLKQKGMQFRLNWYGNAFFVNGSPSTQSAVYLEALEQRKKMGLEEEVSLNDFVLDVGPVYLKADIILLASKYEGFPNVICEAMWYGKVIVASDVSDLSKWIQNGINGYIFHRENREEMLKAIEWALSLSIKEKKKINKVNKRLASTLFNPDEIIQSYLYFYPKNNAMKTSN